MSDIYPDSDLHQEHSGSLIIKGSKY